MIFHYSLAWWLVQLIRLAAAWMALAVLFALAWITAMSRRPRPGRPPQLLTEDEEQAVLLRVAERARTSRGPDLGGFVREVKPPAAPTPTPLP